MQGNQCHDVYNLDEVEPKGRVSPVVQDKRRRPAIRVRPTTAIEAEEPCHDVYDSEREGR